MIQRCTNPNHSFYIHYGGKGVTVCDRWRKFTNFLEDMGERPPNRSIDRIDNNGNYCKENCRWATRGDQAMNVDYSNRSGYKKSEITVIKAT